MDIVVSACLMGVPCRFDGRSKPSSAVARLLASPGVNALPVCPEGASGLPTPRPPAEQRDGCVFLKDGRDVTDLFEKGAAAELDRARTRLGTADGPVRGARLAVLKAASPSCGTSKIYDGTFSKTLVDGDGVFSRRLQEEGFTVVDEKTVERLRPSVEHPVALCLGCGLGSVAKLVKPVRRIPYADIPGFPADAQPVEGHSFEVTIGTLDDVPVVVYPGRIHLYEGHSAAEVVSLVRHAAHLGCQTIVFTASTGAVPGRAHRGLGVITDQLNLTGQNPLVDEVDLRGLDTPFVSMVEAYSPYLRELARGVAADASITLEEGVYAGTLGPSFETPAEVAAIGAAGASFLGMSVVNEVIQARALGMEVLGLTLSANDAGAQGVSHETIVDFAADHREDAEKILRGVLTAL